MKLFSLHLKDIKYFFFVTLLSILFLSSTQVRGSWSTGGPYGGYINCMAMATNPDVMYAGTEGGVFKTVDGGDTWTVTGFPQIPVRAIQVAPVGLCQTINFDDVTAPCSFSETTAIRDEYESQGVVFSGPGGNDGGAVLNECSSSFPDAKSSPNFLAFDIRENLNNEGTAQGPETLSFNPPTSYAKIDAAWQGGTTMEAYDASDNLIDSDTIIPGGSFRPISVSGTGISKVVISFLHNTLLLDDLAFARQPAGPQQDFVFAGTDDGIYKSEDGGDSWTHKGLSGARVNAVAVDPTNPCILYAGTELPSVNYGGRVYKSTDGGESWQEVLSGGLDSVATLLIGTGSSDIYAGTVGHSFYGFWKSADGGETWVGKKVGNLSPQEVQAIAMTPAGVSPSLIYAIASDEVYKSTDQGDSWTSTDVPFISGGAPWALAVDPNPPNLVYVATHYYQGRLFRRTEKDNTWEIKTNGLPPSVPSSIVIDPRDSTVYVGLVEGGVYKSTDKAETWNSSSQGLNNAYVESLAVSPTSSATVCAAIKGEGCYLARTTNGGASWDYLPNSYTNQGAVTIDPQDPSTIYSGIGWGFRSGHQYALKKSEDEGKSWTRTGYLLIVSGNHRLGISDIWVKPGDSSTILAAVVGDPRAGATLYKSTDGGQTWNRDPGLSVSVTTLAADPNDSEIVYIGTEDGYVNRSTDCGGSSWEQITPSDDWAGVVWDIEVDRDSRVYAATDKGLMRWSGTEAGNWEKLSGLPTDDVTALAIDRSANPERVYLGAGQAGVFVSHDGGTTWIAFNEGLGNLSIRKLAISSSQTTMLYAGTLYGGVWSTAIQPDTDNDGLPDNLESQICTDPNDSDTDDDGLLDGVEDANHNGVVDTGETDPCKADTDGDKMPDGWEDNNSLDPLINDAAGDGDKDLLDNIGEFTNNTDPNNPDTDGDKMFDGWEVVNNLDPLADDAQADADGDAYSNLEEYQRQTDPNDPNSHPTNAMPWLPVLLGED